MFIFDEELGLLFHRAKGLGFDLKAMIDIGTAAANSLRERVRSMTLAA